jgi:hypothetical protein
MSKGRSKKLVYAIRDISRQLRVSKKTDRGDTQALAAKLKKLEAELAALSESSELRVAMEALLERKATLVLTDVGDAPVKSGSASGYIWKVAGPLEDGFVHWEVTDYNGNMVDYGQVKAKEGFGHKAPAVVAKAVKLARKAAKREMEGY